MPNEIRNIVVAVDFGLRSEAALEQAARLAARLGARIEVVHAYDPSAYGAGPDMRLALPSGETPTLEAYLADQARASMRQLLERVDSVRGLRVTHKVLRGDPRRAIPRHVARTRADLLVVSTAARRGIARFLTGSVSEHIARAAPCPVLVVPPEKD